jgi:putative ABC transport system ATP-binding protein
MMTSSDTVAVEARDLRFTWPGAARPLLEIAHLVIHQGERVFIHGPSGSGKSTLLGLIAGILRPDSGHLVVNGTALHTLGSAARDRFRGAAIGFIFQQFNLIPYLSVLENVLIPCHLSPARRARALRQAATLREAALRLLERLDLAPDQERPVTRLSVGQQQRVAAARALIGTPPLLIADEPTSSLDAERRDAFLALLLDECARAGSSLLFVSHETRLAAAFSTVLCLRGPADGNFFPCSLGT